MASIHYRACTSAGARFASVSESPANGRAVVTFVGAPSYEIPTSPRSPDMHGDLVAFASGEDPGVSGFGTWMMRHGELPWHPAGITWRSVYPGRFAPDGTYFLSDKWDGGQGRGAFWTWKEPGVLSGPYPSGTTNIEGISDFLPGGPAGWTPVWRWRGAPRTVHGQTLTQWVQAGSWLYGLQQGTDWSIAQRGADPWQLVTTKLAANLFPCVKAQSDGTLLVAWNGNQESFLWSGDGWPLLPAEPPPVVPTFAKTSQKIGIGLFDDLDGPRIQDYQEVVSPSTRAIFWGVGTPGASKSKELAKTLNVEAVAYKDDYGIQPSQVPQGFRALVFAYPKAGMSLSESLNRVDDALDDCTRGGVECDLAVALYCQYKNQGNYALTQQHVLDMLKGVWDLAREYKVGALWGFTKQRFHGGQLVDGVDYWPSLQEAYRRLKSASGDWQHFPPYTEPTPIDPWFPKGRSFLMADVDARGMEVTVGWDPVTHQPIRRFLRVPPGGGDEDIFWDAVEPTPETAVRLRRRGPGECDVLFTLANRELALQPDTRWWQTRPADAVGPFETFRDVAQPPDGLKTIVHVYGQLAVVVL